MLLITANNEQGVCLTNEDIQSDVWVSISERIDNVGDIDREDDVVHH